MQTETLEALKGAIKKWQLIEVGKEEDRGTLNCSLCHLFNTMQTPTQFRCVGCPISEKTGKAGCFDTPYEQYSKQPSPENAHAMVVFLESLLTNV